jgi:putative membrane protein
MSTALVSSSQMLADHYHGPGHWVWWPIFPIMWFLFILTFAIVITRFGWWRRNRCWDEQRRTEPSRAGRTRLAERFAAGEIDEQEYRARLAVLEETSSTDPKGDLR